MKQIGSFGDWIEYVERERALLLFVKTDNCSVCEGLYPQVQILEADFPIPFYKVNVAEVPEIAGQLSCLQRQLSSYSIKGKNMRDLHVLFGWKN